MGFLYFVCAGFWKKLFIIRFKGGKTRRGDRENKKSKKGAKKTGEIRCLVGAAHNRCCSPVKRYPRGGKKP